MTAPPPDQPVLDHASPWMRSILRMLAIRGISWLVLALSLIATAIVSQQAWRQKSISQEIRFNSDAAILCQAIDERLDRYAQVLYGTRGLFAASQVVEDAEFRTYVASLGLDERFPGILAIGFVEMVEHPGLDRFLLEATLNRGSPEIPFTIHPSGERPNYMIVRFVEPVDSNIAALGYDAGTEANRHRTAMAACRKAKPILSAKLDLVQAPGAQGSILFQPIYQRGTIPAEPDEREALLVGWVYAAFQVNLMMDGLQHVTENGLDYELFDGTEPSPDKLLSSSRQEASTERVRFSKSLLLKVFEQPWTLQMRQTNDTGYEPGSLPISVLATSGLCISLLIFGITHSMATTGRRAVDIAFGMTRELRTRETQLRASEERLGMIIEGSNDGVWDWDMITDAVYFSPRWKGMLGYENHEIENTFLSWKNLIHPDDRAQALGMLESYIDGSIPTYKLEHRLRHKDGSWRWILSRGIISRDPDGTAVRMAGSHVDLTELKQTEGKLRQVNEELLRSQAQLQGTLTELQVSHQELERTQLELIQAAKLESIGTLAAGVAHEVKNPLQIILMGLDYLDHQLPDMDEAGRITMADMRDAVVRADAITKELLQFSTSSEFTAAPRDLEVILERSLWLMKSELTKSKITLVKNLAGNLPPVLIDSAKIQQVIINLIVNSVQAMDHVGTLTVTTASGRLAQFLPRHLGSTSPLAPDDEVVVLRLLDSGPGIPDEHMARVFDPFFTTKGVGAGSGLGLSIAKKIIDLHGGLIQACNSPTSGLETTIAFAAARPISPPSSNDFDATI